MGFRDFGANQNQHSGSWEGPRVFVICLQTRITVLLMPLLAVAKGSDVRQKKIKHFIEFIVLAK